MYFVNAHTFIFIVSFKRLKKKKIYSGVKKNSNGSQNKAK